MSRKFDWRHGCRLSADPNPIGRELERLRDEEGRIDEWDVVEAARSPKSALHPCFTWDVQKAAEKCWRSEARYVLAHIVIVHEEGILEGKEVRAYVNTGVARGYRDTEQVLLGEDSRKALVDVALARLISIRNQYQFIEELAAAYEAIDKVKVQWERRNAKPAKKKATKKKRAPRKDGRRKPSKKRSAG